MDHSLCRHHATQHNYLQAHWHAVHSVQYDTACNRSRQGPNDMFSVELSEDAYNLQLAIVKVTCCQDDLRCCFLTGVSAGGSSATIPSSPLLRPTIRA